MNLVKGLVGGAFGFAVGAGIVTAIRAATGAAETWDLEVGMAGG